MVNYIYLRYITSSVILMSENKKSITIGTKVPPRFKQIIEEYIAMDSHVSIGDFLRSAAREKLEKEAPQLMKKLREGEDL